MHYLLIRVAAAFALIAVILAAAFGHQPEQVAAAIWIAILFQFLHSLFLLQIGFHFYALSVKSRTLIVGCCITGMLLFCGGIYCKTLLGLPLLGVVTPIGGLLLIGAWASLIMIRKVKT